MLTKQSRDAVGRGRVENIGVGEKGSSLNRKNRGEIETDEETGMRRRPKVGNFRLAESDGSVGFLDQLSGGLENCDRYCTLRMGTAVIVTFYFILGYRLRH